MHFYFKPIHIFCPSALICGKETAILINSLSPSLRVGPPGTPSETGQDGEENPASLAESCFRELLGRAAYGNMNNAVRPVLV
jgi:hypothetical protein